MSTFIPPTPAATKSAEQHEEPSEQDSFNHLLYKVLRLTSEQVQDLNDWMKHQWIPNVHEIHQVNLNGLRPMLMKNLSKLVVPNLSLLWMDILSLSSSRMVWPMPPPLGYPQIHMSFSPLLMNGIPQSLTMILHTLMDWTPVKSLTNLLVTPCLMPMEISMSASLPTSTSSWMHLQKIVGHTQKSLLSSQPISIRVHPKSLTGMLYAHCLHGHPHPASRTLSMSPPGMELLPTPRITSKSTLSLAILFSTSPDVVKLLQQTPSSLTPLLLMMVQPWPNFSVAVIPLFVMPMASNQPNNSSTPSLITSEKGGPWIPSSVMEANMKSPSESLISSVPYSSKSISLNLIQLWTCHALHQHCHEHLWLPCLLLATLLAVHLCCTQPLGISYSSRHMPSSSFGRNYSRH